MSKKLIFRLTLDLIMTILLLTAFAYQLIGNLAHEVLGIVMFMLFAIHTALNRNWYKNLLKGKYHIRRVLGTIVNLLLLGDIVVLAVSAVTISHSVFGFLHLVGSYGLAQIHSNAANWARVLVFIHLGLHMNMIIGALRKMPRNTKGMGQT